MAQVGLVFTPRTPAQVIETVQAMERHGAYPRPPFHSCS